MFSIVWPSTGALLTTKQTFRCDLSCRFSLCCVWFSPSGRSTTSWSTGQNWTRERSNLRATTQVRLTCHFLFLSCHAPSAGASLHHVAAMNVRTTWMSRFGSVLFSRSSLRSELTLCRPHVVVFRTSWGDFTSGLRGRTSESPQGGAGGCNRGGGRLSLWDLMNGWIETCWQFNSFSPLPPSSSPSPSLRWGEWQRGSKSSKQQPSAQLETRTPAAQTVSLHTHTHAHAHAHTHTHTHTHQFVCVCVCAESGKFKSS